MKPPAGRYSYRQDVMAITTRRRVRDVFARPLVEVPRQALTDKPDNKQTSRKDNQTSRERVPDPSGQD